MLFTTGAWATDHEIAFYAGWGLTSPGTLTYEADVDLDDDLLDGSDTFGAVFGMRYTHWIGNDGFGVEFSRDHPTGQDTAPADPLASSDDSILTTLSQSVSRSSVRSLCRAGDWGVKHR